MELDDLKPPAEVSALYPLAFPTRHAVEHTIRQHRAALVADGVLVVINTRKFIDISKLGPFLERLSAQKLGRVV
jgi:hypothetical protein